MPDENNTINPLLRGLDQGLTQNAATNTKNNGGQVDKNEFLQLLVTQLKNQDPLNPMENDRFAVDLAQFSQLEQLVAIKDKLNAGSTGELSSLSSYLGMQVALDSDTVNVSEGGGGLIRLTLPADAKRVRIELLDSGGAVAKEITLDDVKQGKQTVALTELGIPDGDYKLRVSGEGTTGGELPISGYVAGIVTGFVPGADPSLIVNGKEVKPGGIKEVSLPPAQQA